MAFGLTNYLLTCVHRDAAGHEAQTGAPQLLQAIVVGRIQQTCDPDGCMGSWAAEVRQVSWLALAG